MPVPDSKEVPFILRLFGSFDAQVAGQPLPRLRTQKGQWLLALLLLRQGRQTERTWLAGVFWPESSESQALANLRLSLTDLRRALGTEAGRLQSPTPRTLHLDMTGAWTDVTTFDAAMRQGDTASLETAVAVYRGALLEGCEEDWLLPERHGRAETYHRALETLAEDALATGRSEQALSYLRKLVATDPFRESAQRALMQALANVGDYASVTQVYRDFRLALHSELQTQPAEETVALYQQLQSRRQPQEVKPQPRQSVSARSLPRPLSRLIGREQEIEQVCAYLNTARLVTLSGMGGCGKTRLAIAVGECLLTCFQDAVCFVLLADVTDFHLLTETVHETLGLPRTAQKDPLTQVVSTLSACPSLLILDNFEHLLPDGIAWVNELLTRIPALTCLVTSRQTLSLRGEQEFAVLPLPLPGLSEPFGSLAECASVRLFVERAIAQQSHFELTPRNAATVATICRKVEGIPLALELTAAWTGILTHTQMLERLSERFVLLTNLQHNQPLRHQTMWEAIAGSFRLLSEPLQRFATRLSVFRGGWTLETAQAVCGEPKALEYLRHLRSASLLVTEEVGEEIRFHYLETIREYAEEQLTEREKRTLHRNHAACFLQRVQTTTPASGESPQSEWLNRLDRERDNLRAALDWCLNVEEDAEMGLRLAGLLAPFWDARSYYEEGRERLAKALARTKGSEVTPIKAKALCGAAQLASRQGDYLTAQTLYQEAYLIQRGLADDPGLAKTLSGLGTATLFLSDYPKASGFYEEALTLERKNGERSGEALNLSYLGIVAAAQGSYSKAQSLLEQALTVAQEQGDQARKANILHHLGNIALEQGNCERAQSLYERSYRIHFQQENRGWMGTNLYKLGSVAVFQGDHAAARTLLNQALSLSREVGDMPIEAGCLSWLGSLARHEDDIVTARSLLTQSLKIRIQIGVQREIASSLEWLALVDFTQGYSCRAVRLLGAASALRQTISSPMAPVHRAEYNDALASLRQELGVSGFRSAWHEGQSRPLEETIEQVLE